MSHSRNRHLRNLAAYLGHHGARYLFPLIVTPFLAKMLGASQFSDLVIWNSSIWTCSIFIEFGFYMYAVTETARANSPDDLKSVISRVVTAKALLSPFAVAIYLIVTWRLGLLERNPLAVPMGAVALVAYGSSFAWYFQGKQRGSIAVLTEITPQVLQCALVIWLIRGPADLNIAMGLQTISAVLPVLISMFIINREHRFKISSARSAVKSAFESFPYFAERFCFTAYSAATPMLLAALSTHQQAGFYGVGDKVNAFLTGLSIPATQLMLPIISKRTATEKNWRLSFQVVLALTAITGLGAFVLFFALGPVIPWFFGPEYIPSVAVGRWFCLASCLMAYQTAIANFIIIPSGRARLVATASAGALVISLLTQLVLVPQLGAVGSAIARAVAEGFVAVAFTIAVFPLLRATMEARKQAVPPLRNAPEPASVTEARVEQISPDEFV